MVRSTVIKLIGRGSLYGQIRRIRTRWHKWRKGLKHVHGLAFINPRADARSDLVADAYSFVSFECLLMNRVRIGKYSMLAPYVAIIGADHRYDQPGVPMYFSDRPQIPETVIEEDVWIGFGTVVMQGVRIGRGSIVAARSVVTKDIPRYEVWAGVPARKIRDRFGSVSETDMHDKMIDGPLVQPNYPSHL